MQEETGNEGGKKERKKEKLNFLNKYELMDTNLKIQRRYVYI